eukprot:g72994.t1
MCEALQSRPRELRGLGGSELAQAKDLLEKSPNEKKEKLAVELLRRKPALWQAEALYLVACCVSAGGGVRHSNPDIAFLYYTCALKFAGLGAKRSFFYLDSLWHVVEYLERPDSKVSFVKLKANSDPGFHFKQLLGLMNELKPPHQQQLLERSRKALATSLLSKLAWREMWPTQGEFSIKPMQLSVRMQRFALSIKGREIIKLEDCQKEIRAFFFIAPTKYFWLDLRDVMARWWAARSILHAVVRSCAPREILVGQSVPVEHTQLIKLAATCAKNTSSSSRCLHRGSSLYHLSVLYVTKKSQTFLSFGSNTALNQSTPSAYRVCSCLALTLQPGLGHQCPSG